MGLQEKIKNAETTTWLTGGLTEAEVATLVERGKWIAVIENIKAEIKQNEREVDFMNDYADGYNSGLYDALELIDKHISGKEQE